MKIPLKRKLTDQDVKEIKDFALKSNILCCNKCGRPAGIYRITLYKRYIFIPESSKPLKIYYCTDCLKGE